MVVAWTAAAAIACAGCLGAASAAPRAPHCARPSAAAPLPVTSAAGTIAVAYLSALGNHRYDRAQGFAHACSVAQQHSLDQLWLWMDSMPTQLIRVTGDMVTRSQSGVNVRATLYAKFGPAPHSRFWTLQSR